MLAGKIRRHDASFWLVSTGWSGGGFGVGSRIRLGYTRAIVDAIHSGELEGVETVDDPVFGFAIPTSCPGVPDEILQPRRTWSDPAAYDEAARKLATLFRENFRHYESGAPEEVRDAAPKG